METTLPLHDFPQVPAPTESLTLSSTPAELLRIAVSQNADIDKLAKLMDLQERWEKNESRKAFVVAMNAFKLDPPTILKNKHVKAGQAEYDHATLDNVCRSVIHGLSKHGISHRWKMEQSEQWIKVTCILTHDLGHAEETALHGAPDQTGSKNSIQAIGSTVTYLQRYTLLAACGLAAGNADTDTDGRVTDLQEDRVVECLDWIANAANLNELKRLFGIAYKEAEEAKDKHAMAAYIRAKDIRKKELSNAAD